MPISEDEYDHHGGQSHAMSKAEQRRSNKPIMEKRRRARINHCLNELKSLILDAMKKDPARHSKLEKADILEMTVKHLQSVQRQQLAVAVATDPAVLHKFKTGFNECAGEVSRYIGRLDGVESAVKQRLVSHLAHCVSGLQQLTPLAFTAAVQPPTPNPQPQPPPPLPTAPSAAMPANGPGDVNNNRGAMGNGGGVPATGLQLIPSRLPTGEFALLLPGGGNLQGLPFFPAPPPPVSTGAATAAAATLIDRSHPSAFTAVDRPRRGSPPPPSSHPAYPPHPPVSPASSVSSGDDCSLTSEPYLSSSSPPPPAHPVISAPPPATTKPNLDPQRPQTKSVASVGVGTVTEVKVEFKTIPVHGGMFPIMTSPPASMPMSASSTVHQPLSVITSQPTFKTSAAAAQTETSVAFSGPAIKDALDFSIKKEEHPHLQSTSTQTMASLGMKRSLPASFSVGNHSDVAKNFVSPNKIPRYSFNVKAESESSISHHSPPVTSEPVASSATGSLFKVGTQKHVSTSVGEDLTSKSGQSSSASSSDAKTSPPNSDNDAQGSNKDMWRPW